MGFLHYFLTVYLLVTLTTLEGIIHTQPEYKVINFFNETEGGRRFESEITAKYVEEQMASASVLIWKTFEQRYPDNTKDVKEITLYTAIVYVDFLQFENEIHVDVMYLQAYKGDLKLDFTRRLYRAMTNIWQLAEEDSNASHLRDSIADLIVLKSSYAPNNWVPGLGDRWNQNSIVTALFLDYCSSLRKDFIPKLNQKLKTGFKKEYFHNLLKISVDQLWKEYKSEYK